MKYGKETNVLLALQQMLLLRNFLSYELRTTFMLYKDPGRPFI